MSATEAKGSCGGHRTLGSVKAALTLFHDGQWSLVCNLVLLGSMLVVLFYGLLLMNGNDRVFKCFDLGLGDLVPLCTFNFESYPHFVQVLSSSLLGGLQPLFNLFADELHWLLKLACSYGIRGLLPVLVRS